ncbi:carboxymuconolactone decarboxylase family protein [Mycobacterium intracellulare]|uniref:carboxymuconolactone decarboxylase family protein n=1 Tax=Mycobacterium intracellulare TaxID=1767 RepID=UPI00044E0C3B|nr:carboxymuconolactone decarboxylase family protein [Mycobacterium intracellulare]AOS91870.1 dehydrogenase [Mycobacterium intracellulare subsp. chimaera]ARV81971.1 dehydrogenase [Mycobacterium intracellulare subsp. chimaera]ASL09074.1 dehydrogenase/decarboxylase protein [Mycobacterium intracellulare subsp. chimaera]ASL20889.1 dehydrogenase/decarboxylase protein [Mycobacterium intracellulare subsp. chimaera]ETZ31079.1 carboxymuconolactone decarboxylase family protein [Mycobacterium intracellul
MDLLSSPLGELDPQFEKLGLEVAAFTFGLPGTSVREKLLQTVTLDICRAHLGLAFRMHVTAATMHGVTYGELLAAIRFVAPYSGYPAAADALARLTEIAVETGVDTSDLGEQPGPGAVSDAAGRPDIADEWAAEFADWQLSRAWSEDLLSRRERAIMALTSDVGQQDLDESLRRHVELALDAGLSADDVRDVIRFCAEYGIGRAAAALRALDDVLVG